MSDHTTGLGEHEAWYLDDVAFYLRRLPQEVRAPLLSVVAENLSERPPSASRDELIVALGEPAEYADRLRRDAEPRPIVHHRRRPRTAGGRAGAAVVVLALLAGIGLGWQRWVVDPQVGNSCGGVGGDHRVTVEQREAAGATEHLVSYVDDAEITLLLCLTAGERVRIIDVSLDQPPYTHTLFRQTGLRLRPVSDSGESDRPFEPFMLETSGEDGFRFLKVIGRLGGCEDYAEGSSTSYDEVKVTYEQHGRRRTTAVDLGPRYSVVSPPVAECPRPRESGD